jgi:hypothetical protein
VPKVARAVVDTIGTSVRVVASLTARIEVRYTQPQVIQATTNRFSIAKPLSFRDFHDTLPLLHDEASRRVAFKPNCGQRAHYHTLPVKICYILSLQEKTRQTASVLQGAAALQSG